MEKPSAKNWVDDSPRHLPESEWLGSSPNRWGLDTLGLGGKMIRIWFIWATVLGFLSVALGAFGAHSLKNVLDEYGKAIYEKAVLYQMFHVMALFALGFLQHSHQEACFAPAGWGFVLGILFFSGSLYLLAVTGLKWLGAITPLGGVSFLFGWAWLLWTMIRLRS
jgi:uncharacterized membrane protein YgdD (TMEM256/DUF423 family)